MTYLALIIYMLICHSNEMDTKIITLKKHTQQIREIVYSNLSFGTMVSQIRMTIEDIQKNIIDVESLSHCIKSYGNEIKRITGESIKKDK